MISHRIIGLAAALALLGGCSTVSDTASDVGGFLWPFGGDDEADQGDAPDEEARMSILTLEESLTVDPDKSDVQVYLPTSYRNDAWPMAGGYATHAIEHLQAGGLSVAWSTDVGQGSSRTSRVIAQPVVSGGMIYAMDGDNQVTALDAETGQKRWDTTIKSENKRDKEAFGGGVAVGEGRVYVSSGYGAVVALNAQTGNEVWRRDTTSPMQSAPAIADGRVFAITDDNELYVLDSATGDLLWTYQSIAESARLLTAPAPAIVDDIVVAPFASGELVALRVENGRPIWQDVLSRGSQLTPMSSLNDIPAPPVVSNGIVYAMSHSGVLVAINLQTGERVWSKPAGGSNMPWLAGDFIFAITGEGELLAMSREDGGIVWLTSLPVFENPKKRKDRISWAGPILAGNQLILASSVDGGRVVDPISGRITSDFDTKGDVYVPPIVANGTVYILNDEAELIAYR